MASDPSIASVLASPSQRCPECGYDLQGLPLSHGPWVPSLRIYLACAVCLLVVSIADVLEALANYSLAVWGVSQISQSGFWTALSFVWPSIDWQTRTLFMMDLIGVVFCGYLVVQTLKLPPVLSAHVRLKWMFLTAAGWIVVVKLVEFVLTLLLLL